MAPHNLTQHHYTFTQELRETGIQNQQVHDDNVAHRDRMATERAIRDKAREVREDKELALANTRETNRAAEAAERLALDKAQGERDSASQAQFMSMMTAMMNK
jgi:hypothetical protein